MKPKPAVGGLPRPLRLLLLIAALLIGLAMLLLYAPAGAISLALERSGADARLLAPSGRLQQGSGRLTIDRQDIGLLRWQIRWTALLRGELTVHLELEGPDYEANGKVRLGPRRQWVTAVEGRLGEAGLRRLLAPYDIHPAGDFDLVGGHLEAHRRQLTEASGHAHWSGGFVRYMLAEQSWTVEFPPLDAHLQLRDGQPLLEVMDADGNELLDLRLDFEGWAHLRIRHRFITMAGFPWPDGPAPDTVLIELSERVF